MLQFIEPDTLQVAVRSEGSSGGPWLGSILGAQMHGLAPAPVTWSPCPSMGSLHIPQLLPGVNVPSWHLLLNVRPLLTGHLLGRFGRLSAASEHAMALFLFLCPIE